ncbi:hypothetical protein [Bacteroides fragilis]|uniref:hypothetical protein n=1 Tax=Bacteroides fragilis TaxID=817 RepID=UPI0024555197|nr:hypothetical protein [Bacteroides fragilis]
MKFQNGWTHKRDSYDIYIDEPEHRDILSYYRTGKIEALKAAREKAVYLLEAMGKGPGEGIRIMVERDVGEELFAKATYHRFPRFRSREATR